MKKILLTSLISIIFLTAFSQTYHPLIRSNFNWDIEYLDFSSICQVTGMGKYFFKGDTIVSGHKYKIVNAFSTSVINPDPVCPTYGIDTTKTFKTHILLREDTATKQVYIYDRSQNRDDLFYDFSLAVGDTLKSHYAALGYPLVIDSVGTITLYDGTQRKIFFLNEIGAYYIESLGGSEGLHHRFVHPIGGEQNWLRCFTENNIKIWGNNCLNYVGVSKSKENNILKIFPNPCKEYVNINFNKFFQAKFKLLDINGKLLISKDISTNHLKIDLTELTNGIYFYQVYDMLDKPIKTGKIIKE